MNLLIVSLVLLSVAYSVAANGHAIVTAARSQIGVPYSWGGGNWAGKSKGIDQGAHTVGFDCSGLAQYAVYHGTHKKIARVASAQYNDHQCHHVAFGKHQPGDLVFFANSGGIHHVAIVSGPHTMIHAPHTGAKVQESSIKQSELVKNVARCF